MSSVKVLEGQWYSDRSTHDVFCVIAIDEADGVIGVRDRYGDIDEFDVDEWSTMDLEPCAAPDERSIWWDESDTEESERDARGNLQARGAAVPDSARQGREPSATHHIKSSGTT